MLAIDLEDWAWRGDVWLWKSETESRLHQVQHLLHQSELGITKCGHHFRKWWEGWWRWRRWKRTVWVVAQDVDTLAAEVLQRLLMTCRSVDEPFYATTVQRVCCKDHSRKARSCTRVLVQSHLLREVDALMRILALSRSTRCILQKASLSFCCFGTTDSSSWQSSSSTR